MTMVATPRLGPTLAATHTSPPLVAAALPLVGPSHPPAPPRRPLRRRPPACHQRRAWCCARWPCPTRTRRSHAPKLSTRLRARASPPTWPPCSPAHSCESVWVWWRGKGCSCLLMRFQATTNAASPKLWRPRCPTTWSTLAAALPPTPSSSLLTRGPSCRRCGTQLRQGARCTQRRFAPPRALTTCPTPSLASTSSRRSTRSTP